MGKKEADGRSRRQDEERRHGDAETRRRGDAFVNRSQFVTGSVLQLLCG